MKLFFLVGIALPFCCAQTHFPHIQLILYHGRYLPWNKLKENCLCSYKQTRHNNLYL